MKYLKDPNGNVFKLDAVENMKIIKDDQVLVAGEGATILSLYLAPTPELAQRDLDDMSACLQSPHSARQPTYDYLREGVEEQQG